MYAEQGDISGLAGDLLSAPDDILSSNLALLAECWGAGGTFRDNKWSDIAVARLFHLITGGNALLARRSLAALANIDAAATKTAMRNLIRDASGNLVDGPAAAYAVAIFGNGVIDEVISTVVSRGFDKNLLDNFKLLPRLMAVEKLTELILRNDWVVEDYRTISHIRRDAARRMADIGEEIAIRPLKELVAAEQLSVFEKEGVITALGTIQDFAARQFLRAVMSGDYPLACKVEAAGCLAPDEDAKHFLLRIVDDTKADYFRRRDAALAVAKFNLSDPDLSFLRHLLFDRAPKFYGGPSLAAEAVACAGTAASRAMLKDAFAFWRKSTHPDAKIIAREIGNTLNMREPTSDLREALDFARGPESGRPINLELPEMAEEYARRSPAAATDLFVLALDDYKEQVIYAGTLASAVLQIVARITLTDRLLNAVIDFAKRSPQDESRWVAVDAVWRRRDLTPTQRLFFGVPRGAGGRG
jgi:hypothetical protein